MSKVIKFPEREPDDGDAPEMMPFWDRLGTDEGGLPTHFPMGVNAQGQGPEDDLLAHHVICWCGDEDCLLTGVLMWAYRLGRKEGSSGEFRAAALDVRREDG